MKKTIAIILAVVLMLICVLSVTAEDVSVKTDSDNLAFSARAEAISSYKDTTNNYDLHPGRLNDGNRNLTNNGAERWTTKEWRASTLATTPIWCQYVWDTPVEFNTVDIYEYKAGKVYRTGNFGLSVSDDGVVFTDVYTDYSIGECKSIYLKKQIKAKYLRLTIYSALPGETDIPCINEIEVYNKNLPISERAEITASSSKENYGPEKLNDGSLEDADRWETEQGAEAPVYLNFKWGEKVSFDTLTLYEYAVNGSYSVREFSVETLNGDKWERVFEGKTIGERLDARFSRTVYTTDLRIIFTSFSGSAISLFEIEMQNNNTGRNVQNLALEAEASASSSTRTFPVSNVIDGDLSNRHVPLDSATKPITITLKWNSAITFDTVTLYEWIDGNGDYRANDIALEISDDGNEWETIYEGTGIGDKFVFSSPEMYTAKHLRLVMKNLMEGLPDIYNPCIREIEVTKQGDNANILDVALNGEFEIDELTSTVYLYVYEGAVDLSEPFAPKMTVSEGATITPEGAQNFSSPVKYRVTSPNGRITREYTVMADYKKLLTDSDLSDKGSEEVNVFGPTPSENQYKYQKQELAAFCHFGMKTFAGLELATEKIPIETWTLDEKADADGYVRTLKEAGFNMVIFTAKHHDGLCMWDTKWTDYNVTNTVYGTDFLAELSASCNKYDMDMGLYLQPWDIHSEYYGYYDENGNQTDAEHDVLDYNDFYAGQLEEILGNPIYGHNGQFKEIWLDGAKVDGEPQEYDFDRYISIMHKHEGEDVLIFGGKKYAKVRWVANENGIANEETWSKANGYIEDGKAYVNDAGMVVVYDGFKTNMGYKNGNVWMVNECDTVITAGWFWGENKSTPKSLEDLRNIYLKSVGHNSVLLLNVPFNTSGALDPAIANRLVEFGTNIKNSFETENLVATEGVTVSANEVLNGDIKFKPSNVFDGNDNTYWTAEKGSKETTLRIDFGKSITFDAITLEEAIQFGQRVESFKVMYKNSDGKWTEFTSGTTIGGKRVALENAVSAREIIINFVGLTDPSGEVATPVISHVGVYKATKAFEKTAGAPEGIESYDNEDTAVFSADGWTNVTDRNCVSGSFASGAEGKTMTITFSGTKAWVMGNKGRTAYSFKYTVNGKHETLVTNTPEKGNTTKYSQILLETADLPDTEHTIEITVLSGTVEIDALFVLENGGKGYLEFEQNAYTVNEDMSYEIKVVRKGGTKGSISALIQDMPGSAVQTHYYNTEGIRVDFADGETEKTFTLRTMRYPQATGTLSFTLEIINADEEDDTFAAGFNTPVLVNIIDAESYDGAFVKSFEIESLPDKLTYKLGDPLDLTGLKIKATYVTGDTRILYADQYKADVDVLKESGETTVTLSAIYDDASVSFKVNVAVNGDVNGDGKTDICDLVAIQLGNKAGDLDGDGDVDKEDAAILRRHLIGEKPLS